MSMKKRLVLLAFLLKVAAVSVFAQSKPKAGDVISGIVSDMEGPMIMVNVTERDTADRIVAHTITDIEGKFSFKLVHPKDSLKVTYVGYEPVSISIDTTYFEIKMKENPALSAVDIISDPSYEKAGYSVPVRITLSKKKKKTINKRLSGGKGSEQEVGQTA